MDFLVRIKRYGLDFHEVFFFFYVRVHSYTYIEYTSVVLSQCFSLSNNKPARIRGVQVIFSFD